MPTPILIHGKPSHSQLDEWFKSSEEVSFTDKKGDAYLGKIKSYQPMGDDALIWVENSRFGLYLRDVDTYVTTPKIETIFVNADSTSPEKVSLQAKDKIFWVNKTILSQRLEFFNAMFRSGMSESYAKNIDLSLTFSAEELDVLLFLVNSDDYRSLTLEQAQILVEAADKVAASEIADKAKMRIDECMQLINKEFLLAIHARNYDKCTEMLLKGANINEKFGKYSLDSHDVCSFCGPNDTPLTYAVKKEDKKLMEFLVKNEANTEVFVSGETPLMKAAFQHNPTLVKLLLEHGASPNANDGFAMCMVFLGMRDWLLEQQEKSASEIVRLFLANGFIGDPEKIAATLKTRGYSEQIINLFSKIWKEQNSLMASSESIGHAPESLEQSASSRLTQKQYQMLTLHVLNKPAVIEALHSHIISIQDIEEQFENLSEEQIEKIGRIALTHQSCIDAIADGRTTIEQLADMREDDLMFIIESDNYPRPGLK